MKILIGLLAIISIRLMFANWKDFVAAIRYYYWKKNRFSVKNIYIYNPGNLTEEEVQEQKLKYKRDQEINALKAVEIHLSGVLFFLIISIICIYAYIFLL